MSRSKVSVGGQSGENTMSELERSWDSADSRYNPDAGRFCCPGPASRRVGISHGKARSHSMIDL